MTGIFTGSFDPFTIGHDDIVRRALPLFSRIVIGVGVNERKQYMQSADERCAAIRRIYEGEEKIEVKAYSDLTVDTRSTRTQSSAASPATAIMVYRWIMAAGISISTIMERYGTRVGSRVRRHLIFMSVVMV